MTLLPLVASDQPAAEAITCSLRSCSLTAPGSLSKAELTAGLVAVGRGLVAGTVLAGQLVVISPTAAAALAAGLSVS